MNGAQQDDCGDRKGQDTCFAGSSAGGEAFPASAAGGDPFRSCAGVGGRGGGHGRGLIVAVAAAEPGDAPNGDVSAGGDERYAAPNPRGA